MSLRDPDPPVPALLSVWLNELRFSDAYVVLGTMGRGVGMRLLPEGVPAFHYVQRGGCEVRFADRTVQLDEGELLLMRSGLARVVMRHPGDRIESLAERLQSSVVSGRIATFSSGGPEPALVVGVAACPVDCRVPVLSALPAVAHLPREIMPSRLRAQLDHLIEEASAGRTAVEPVVARLAEVVVLMAARAVLERVDAVSPMVRAARDPRMAAALGAIHHAAARPWTVERLARVAGMSRSAFAARFCEMFGEGPMRYVQRERMRVARTLLSAGEPVQLVAERVGYASATSFSSAFRRVEGLSPSAVRHP